MISYLSPPPCFLPSTRFMRKGSHGFQVQPLSSYCACSFSLDSSPIYVGATIPNRRDCFFAECWSWRRSFPRKRAWRFPYLSLSMPCSFVLRTVRFLFAVLLPWLLP